MKQKIEKKIMKNEKLGILFLIIFLKFFCLFFTFKKLIFCETIPQLWIGILLLSIIVVFMYSNKLFLTLLLLFSVINNHKCYNKHDDTQNNDTNGNGF